MSNIVLVGAGGTGMSGVAGMLHDLGYTNIVAINEDENQLTQKLKEKGIKVILGHGKYTLHQTDVVIYSAAAKESREVLAARALMKAKQDPMIILNYFEFLGEVSKYFMTIGIAGTNGKSSTTALAITTAKDTLPGFALGILGALVPQLDNNSYYIAPDKKSEIKTIFDFMLNKKKSHELQHDAYALIKKYYFMVEACEYRRHFLHLDLDYALITSLELDHTDYYQDMDDYLSAFTQLGSKVKKSIFIPKGLDLLPSTSNLLPISIQSIPFTHIRGAYNNSNGSLVSALLTTLNVSGFEEKLYSFQGLRRRMELIYTSPNGAKIFSDYGHMASSVAFGLQSLRQHFAHKHITCIFQPHQINRIVTGRDDFVASMQGYDQVIIYDIYAARENLPELVAKIPKLDGISNLPQLGDAFAQACGGTYTDHFDDITSIIQSAKKDDIIVIYSAGDIDFKLRNYLAK